MRTADEPASPQGVAQSYKDIEGNRRLRAVENTGGLTKLEYFAGLVLPSITEGVYRATDKEYAHAANGVGLSEDCDAPTVAARMAIKHAESLCAELDKRKETKP